MTDAFYQRLFRFYAESAGNQFGAMSPIWEGIFKNHHAPLAAALAAESIADTRAILESGSCLHGITGNPFIGSNNNELNRELSAVAVTLGLLPLWNPSQPSDIADRDNPSLMARLERHFGCKSTLPIRWLSPEGVACAFRFPTMAYLVGATAMFLGSPPENVIEIGPGLGLAGLLLRGLGCRRYTVVDLPIGGVIVGWMLAAFLGEKQVRFSNEDESEAYAWIFAPDTIGKLGGVYDAVLNVDSFPEIPPPCQDAYIAMAARRLFSEGFFYSINQESANNGQRSINRAMREKGDFRCAVRKIFPLRPGYIEEIYLPT